MTQTDLTRLIHFALGPRGRLDLLLAVHRGQIRVIEFDREVMLPSRELKPSTRPTIAVVADDDCASSACGWAAASRVLSWAPRRTDLRRRRRCAGLSVRRRNGCCRPAGGADRNGFRTRGRVERSPEPAWRATPRPSAAGGFVPRRARPAANAMSALSEKSRQHLGKVLALRKARRMTAPGIGTEAVIAVTFFPQRRRTPNARRRSICPTSPTASPRPRHPARPRCPG